MHRAAYLYVGLTPLRSVQIIVVILADQETRVAFEESLGVFHTYIICRNVASCRTSVSCRVACSCIRHEQYNSRTSNRLDRARHRSHELTKSYQSPEIWPYFVCNRPQGRSDPFLPVGNRPILTVATLNQAPFLLQILRLDPLDLWRSSTRPVNKETKQHMHLGNTVEGSVGKANTSITVIMRHCTTLCENQQAMLLYNVDCGI